jgi:uncharacterized protein (TIGR01777 family)
MRLGVTGATGLIGSALICALDPSRHEIVVLTRSPEKALRLFPWAECVVWDPASDLPLDPAMENLDAMVHLAGESIAAGRWNARRKEAIGESRVAGTRNLVNLLGQLEDPPLVLVSGSAVGYYGSREDKPLEEGEPSAEDFLGQVCQQWEGEAERAAEFGTRVVLLRTGLVLSAQGGALAQMLLPFKMFVGGPLASGLQWMSWIHIQDQIGAIQHVLANPEVQGPVNLTAPHPVTNEEFSKTLASVLKRPALFRVPAFVLRLVLGEMAEALLLGGQRVIPGKLQQSGYEFQYPVLRGAFENLLT